MLGVIRDERTRSVVRAALDGGWEWRGYTKGGHVEIRWPATDALLHCGTTPAQNSWKQFARDVERVSGLVVWRKGNRRRSHKRPNAPDAQVEAARRKHRAEYEARLARQAVDRQAARQAEEIRQLEAQRASYADDRRREIEALMRPGNGR